MSDTQVKTEVPAVPEGHKALEWKHWYPGKIGFANAVGHYSGCMFKIFRPEMRGDVPVEASQVANEWFTVNPGMLVVEATPFGGGAVEAIFCVFTKILSPEEYDENDDIMREVGELREKRARERKERQAEAEAKANEASVKAAEEAAAAEKELKRLAELGKRHEKNCGKKGA